MQGIPMMNFDTDMEKAALEVARKRVGAALEMIGFDKAPIDWQAEDAMAIVEAAVGGFRWEIARLSNNGEVPF